MTATSPVLQCKTRDVNGWPVQRIAVYFTGGTGVMNGTLYFWDSQVLQWVKVNTSVVAMSLNTLYFFDTAVICETTPLSGNLGQNGSSSQAGAMELFLLLADAGALSNSVFTIAMAPDISTVGT